MPPDLLWNDQGRGRRCSDPATLRLILLLPVALPAHDLGELAANDQLNQTADDLTDDLECLPSGSCRAAPPARLKAPWPSTPLPPVW